MIRRVSLALAGAALLGAAMPVQAQVFYAQPRGHDSVDFFSPYDESYGTSPSFEIAPRGYGYAPAVRVVERCQYPDGWNVTDFSRDLNGIPAGIDHTCRTGAPRGAGIRARY